MSQNTELDNQDASTEDVVVQPRGYLLTWNPERYDWSGVTTSDNWSCGNNKQIKKGDLLFLHKQGSSPRGIIGASYATRDAYQDEHWDPERAADGDTANYVGVVWDQLIDPRDFPPLSPDELPIAVRESVNWSTPSSGINIKSECLNVLLNAWKEHFRQYRSKLVSPQKEFLNILLGYKENNTVIYSPVQNKRYLVAKVNDNSAEIIRVDGGNNIVVTQESYQRLIDALHRSNGTIDYDTYPGDVALKATLLQGNSVHLSANRKEILDLSDQNKAFKNLLAHIKELNVNRNGESVKLYKPILLAAVIKGIHSGELIENKIYFDWVLPRFKSLMSNLGEESKDIQAAHAFARLARDQIWMLSHKDQNKLMDTDSVSTQAVRDLISFASIKETYWPMLQSAESRTRVLDYIDQFWLKRKEMNPRYWWVNQGYTYSQERELGLIWAPQANEKGTSFFHWQNVSKVKTGDIIFSYSGGHVQAVSIATSDGHEADKPSELSGYKWSSKGWSALLNQHSLESPIPLESVSGPIQALDLEQGPINSVGRVNQAYLFSLSEDAARVIAKQLDIHLLPDEIAKPLKTLLAGDNEVVIITDNFGIDEALEDLFIEKEEFKATLSSWHRKKNLILAGPPGVGKTFYAKRLAYAIMGMKRPDRVEMVQFHQSYSYEDFIQGWRPKEGGGFFRKNGIFHEFCTRAANDPEQNSYVFIIDEINRGNLSRIFGELMMLIEHDHRGSDFSLPLTYSHDQSERFYVPDNLYILGMMNTADRSLAIVDYALRRRFSFTNLMPAFSSPKFKAHLLKQVQPAVVELIIQRIGNLNRQIGEDRHLGTGFELGHSFFCPSKSLANLGMEWYRSIILHEIKPLLDEYWFDNKEKVSQIIEELLA